MTDLGTFEVEVQVQDNGVLDIYISHDGNSGSHYTDVTPDKAGEYLADDIDCFMEEYSR